MASSAPRRVARPKTILDPPSVRITADGRVDKADFEHFVRTVNEYTRSRPDQMDGLRKPVGDYSFTASGAVTAETVVLQITGFVFEDNAAYRVSWGNLCSTGTANAEAIFRVRKTDATGTIWVLGGRTPMPGTAVSYNANGQGFIIREAGAGNITLDVVLTLAGSGGSVQQQASSDQPRYLVLEYAGLATDYPFAHTVR